MIKTTIEERILFYRNLRGWSQGQLAREIGLATGKEPGRDVISQYENGKRKVPSELVPVLAGIFGTTTDALFYKPSDIEADNDQEDVTDYVIAAKSQGDNDKALEIAMEALIKARMAMEKIKIECDYYRHAAKAYKNHYETCNAKLDELHKRTTKAIADQDDPEELRQYKGLI